MQARGDVRSKTAKKKNQTRVTISQTVFSPQIKYLLAVRPDHLSLTLLREVYPSVFSALSDPADDVAGVAAAALLPAVDALLDAPEKSLGVGLTALIDKLWEALRDLVSLHLF